jgi:hypothetical protein
VAKEDKPRKSFMGGKINFNIGNRNNREMAEEPLRPSIAAAAAAQLLELEAEAEIEAVAGIPDDYNVSSVIGYAEEDDEYVGEEEYDTEEEDYEDEQDKHVQETVRCSVI